MKVEFYKRYSEIDKHNEYAVYCSDTIWLAWVFFGIGQQLNNKAVYLCPYKPFWANKPVKTYKYNGATKVGFLIANRINTYERLLES